MFAATDVGPRAQNLPLLLWSKLTGSGRVVVPLARKGSGQAFVNELRGKLEAGRFVAVVDRHYPLSGIADAYRYVQSEQKAGVVVVDVIAEDRPA